MPRLVVLKGDKEGQTFEVKDDNITIGRDPGQKMPIEDLACSREHAEVFRIGEMYFIRDLDSRNGTFVNDIQITEELLRSGDKIRIGSTVFLFEETPAKTAPPEEAIDEIPVELDELEPTMELPLTAEAQEPAASPTSPEKRTSSQVVSRNLSVLYEIANLLTIERDVGKVMQKMLELAVKSTNADSGYVFAKEPGTGKILPKVSYEREKMESPKISRTIIKKVIDETRSIMTSDAAKDSRFRASDSILIKKIKSVICAPLISLEELKGVVYLHSSKMGTTFTADDLELATAIGIQGGMALTTVSLLESQKQTLANLIKTLVSIMEMKDPKTQGHSERVARYTIAVAKQLKLSRYECQQAKLAALLHDIGKIAESHVPAADRLTEIKQHVILGEKIVRDIGGLDDILPAIRHHHEKTDGSGYPDGLSASRIPLLARIITSTNAFDNMTTFGGVSGTGLPVKDALLEIGRQGGKEFDDTIVEALLICHRNGSLYSTEDVLENMTV